MTDINVVSRTQHIIVDPASNSVSVTNSGPPGPGGAPGVSGVASATTTTDTGGFYVSDNVEGQLQELGENREVQDDAITDHESRIGVNENALTDHESRIDTNETALAGQVVTNGAVSGEITSLDGRVDAVELAVTAIEALNVVQQNAIDTNDDAILVNTNAIDNLVVALDALADRVEALENP